MEKMSKRITQDRIGALPDSVLLHILSFLNMKEVVKTSVLSKRWQYIWTSVPTLTFEYCLVTDESTDKFVAWVNRTLLLCRNTSIEKFKVEFICFNRFASDIDVWARFAAEKKLRDLSLHLLFSKSYSLPQSICCNSFLTNLSIEGCRVVPRGGLSWISLKSLSIACVELNDDTIAKILTGSPMLEYLRISACWGISRLDINNDSLRELVIDDCFTMWNYQALMEISARNHIFEISAPNLQSLHILGQLRRQFRLMSFSSLLRVELNLSCAVNDSDAKCEKKCSDFIEILGSLHHVVELELGRYCIQIFYRMENRCWSGRRMENFPLPHLKAVKFLGFKKLGDVDEFTLALTQVLLENAGVLEKIVISVGEYLMLVMPQR